MKPVLSKDRPSYVRAKAEGVFYQGFAAALQDDFGGCILMAKDRETLLKRWNSITEIGLDFNKVKQVCLFLATDTSVALNAVE